MIEEILLSAVLSFSPPQKYDKQLNYLQKRLARDGYDITEYIEDPRFEIYRPVKRPKDASKRPMYTNYADTTQSWYMMHDSIESCADFLEEELKFLIDLEKEYGPSAEKCSMVSQYELETNRGNFKGNHIAFNALVTKYLRRTGKKRERFYEYLKYFLDVATDTTDNIILPKDIFEIMGSSAGAIGDAQVMGDILMEYAKDGNGDGLIDPNNRYDALTILANFRKQNGGDENLPRAIYLYNSGHPFYQSSITEYTSELKKVMDKREKEFFSNIEPLSPISSPIGVSPMKNIPLKKMKFHSQPIHNRKRLFRRKTP